MWLLTLIFLVSLPAVTTRFYASDEVEYFSWLRSAWFDHDVNFENEYTHFYETGGVHDAGFHETFLELSNEIGRRYNFAPIGTALLWTPFFAGGDLIAHLSGAPVDGYSPPYIDAVAYGSAVYGFVGVLLTLAIVRRILGDGLGASVAVWTGTPLVFYMYVAPGFAHACSAFAVSLFLWTWLNVRERWTRRGAVLLGLAGALMAMVREQDLFFVAGPALDFLRAWIMSASSDGRRGPSRRHGLMAPAIFGTASFLLAYAPQLAAYKVLNGHFGPTKRVSAKMTWTAPHFFQVLVSPEHGFFFWTPLALVGVCGLVWLAVARGRERADTRWIAVLALLMFGLQVYVSGSVESWTVAGSFGQRRFVATTPLLALGVAALVPIGVSAAARASRILLAAVLLLCVWWNVGMMAQFGLHTMDRQRLTLRDNAHATFVTLPATAPSIVWRYLFARSSFFGLPRQ